MNNQFSTEFNRPLGYILGVLALLISVIAAYYSVIGLAEIFSSSKTEIIIMGSLLEAAKIAIVLWLHRHFHSSVGRLIKLYLFVAVLSLMILTSIGIFGFLSKAHLGQEATIGQATTSVSLIDARIDRNTREIERFETISKQLDSAVQNFIDAGFITRGLKAREDQASERELVQTELARLYSEQEDLTLQRIEENQKLQAVEMEVGPLKYVAEVVYGTNDSETLGKAVRLMILFIMLVFDPLAICMLIAAQATLMVPHQKITLPKEPEEDLLGLPPVPEEEPIDPEQDLLSGGGIISEEPSGRVIRRRSKGSADKEGFMMT